MGVVKYALPRQISVTFVQKVSEICRGKAYFTTPMTLGRYLLMDFMTKRVRTVH